MVVYRLETVDIDGGLTQMDTKNFHRAMELLSEMLDSDTNPFLSFTISIIEDLEDAGRTPRGCVD